MRAFLVSITKQGPRPKSVKNYYVDLSCLFRFLQTEGCSYHPRSTLSAAASARGSDSAVHGGSGQGTTHCRQAFSEPQAREALLLLMLDTAARAVKYVVCACRPRPGNRRCQVVGKGTSAAPFLLGADGTGAPPLPFTAGRDRRTRSSSVSEERTGCALSRYGLLDMVARVEPIRRTTGRETIPAYAQTHSKSSTCGVVATFSRSRATRPYGTAHGQPLPVAVAGRCGGPTPPVLAR